ncbi:hypothetical protein PR048_000682 [Dryococelus australis]|uniref:Uncharacterized protein n=1 Tax=Dryococelus australis TaxID=614101 RepID=A0ABQ9IFB5_9NEOP|nr:hypothetical protein PR048_000682 [Dryococelus australis]
MRLTWTHLAAQLYGLVPLVPRPTGKNGFLIPRVVTPISTAHWLSAVTVEGDDWTSVLQEVSNTVWTYGLEVPSHEVQVGKRCSDVSASDAILLACAAGLRETSSSLLHYLARDLTGSTRGAASKLHEPYQSPDEKFTRHFCRVARRHCARRLGNVFIWRTARGLPAFAPSQFSGGLVMRTLQSTVGYEKNCISDTPSQAGVQSEYLCWVCCGEPDKEQPEQNSLSSRCSDTWLPVVSPRCCFHEVKPGVVKYRSSSQNDTAAVFIFITLGFAQPVRSKWNDSNHTILRETPLRSNELRSVIWPLQDTNSTFRITAANSTAATFLALQFERYPLDGAASVIPMGLARIARALLQQSFRELRRMERCRNERAGETGDPRENPPTNGVVRHDFDAKIRWPGRGLNPDRLGRRAG